MTLRAWVRVSAGGLPLLMGVQVVWFLRTVSSVANWVGVRLVVRWWCNGSSGAVLRILLAFYPLGCRVVGPLSSWWVGFLNKPHCITETSQDALRVSWDPF